MKPYKPQKALIVSESESISDWDGLKRTIKFDFLLLAGLPKTK